MGGEHQQSRLAGVALRCQPDARLAALARGGYPRAFDEIARRYRAALVSYAGSIVPSHRAEDVVQDAFVKAYRSLPRSDEDLHLRPWLYTIVRNTALNDLRDQRVHEHLDENWDGVPQPAEVAAQRAELASVVGRIQDLPTPQREALVKRELEGRSHEEIAARMGATPGAVRGLIFRARAALRDGAGILIPMPALRALLDAGPMQAETAGVGIGGAAAGLTAGGGGGLAIKAGATLLVAGLAVGSGVAVHDRGENRDASAAMVAQHRHSPPGHARSSVTGTSAAGSHSGSGAGGDGSGRGPGSGGSSGRGSNHDSSSSGPGSSERSSTGGHRSGPGGGDDGSDGHGGPGGEPSGHEGSNDTSGHSGSGSSGHGGSGGTSGEGSGGGSGTSGSGSSGSGSGSSGSGGGSSGSGGGSTGSGDVGGGSGGDGGSGSSHEGGDVTTLDAEPSP
jgi:RNA polymerase sigma factor (sigma-70 family)